MTSFVTAADGTSFFGHRSINFPSQPTVDFEFNSSGAGAQSSVIQAGAQISVSGTGSRSSAIGTGSQASFSGTELQISAIEAGDRGLRSGSGSQSSATGAGAQISVSGTESLSLSNGAADLEDLTGIPMQLNSQTDGEQVLATAILNSVPVDNVQGRIVGRELFPSVIRSTARTQPTSTVTSGALEALETTTGTGTPRTPSSAMPLPAPSTRSIRRVGNSQPQPSSGLEATTQASVRWFNSQSRCNTLLARAKLLAYQSSMSVNRKREQVLELLRLEAEARLKKLSPDVVLPPPTEPLFNYDNALCTMDPNEFLQSSDEEEAAEPNVDFRKVPIWNCVVLVFALKTENDNARFSSQLN